VGALPKRKVSKARQGKRRAHLHLKMVRLVECSHCQELKMPHTVCPHCGYYRGKQVMKIKTAKKEK